MARKMNRPKTADYPLPRSLTEAFISDLESVISTDAGPAADYLKSTWLSKFVDSDPKEAKVRRCKAIEKWLSTELTNKATNARLSLWGDSESVSVLPGVSAKRFLDRVSLNVRQILFVSPSLDLRHGGFSGGSSTSKRRLDGHPAIKFLDKADVTRPALPIFRDIIRGTRWADHMAEPGLDPKFVVGNVMFTVPKNSDIDRVACKEPDLNMFLQKSIGNQIRYLLKRRAGIDLNDQSINGELARIGSETGVLATLDLSSASDSVTTEFVRRVVPDDWFFYMDQFRSHLTVIDGDVHENEMFSSMGNGFTFELESLLFYSVARAVAYFSGVKGRLSVYGDDIIAPSLMYQDLVSALCFVGFTVNPKKSFHEGPFRESCGKHWHDGLDVSPFYLKGPFKTVSDLILTLNQLIGWASRTLSVVDPRYEAVILKYLQHIPTDLYGGQDLTSRSSVVTGDRPRKQLSPVIEVISHSHVGGLLFWLFISEPRDAAPDDRLTVDDYKPPRFYRMVRNRQVELDLPIFLSRYGI